MTLTNCPCSACVADQQAMSKQAVMCEEGYENGLNCTCGFQWTETIEQQALRHAWDALQSVPAYVERRQES